MHKSERMVEFMFYDTFTFLCKKKGLSPSKAAIDAKISKSLVTKWKTNGTEVPSPEVLKKLSVFFGVTPDYLLGYDTQSQIDTLSQQISQLKEEIRTASAERKGELEATLLVLEESHEDLLLAQSLTANGKKEDKKISSDELALTEGEKAWIRLLRRVPAEEGDSKFHEFRFLRAGLCLPSAPIPGACRRCSCTGVCLRSP